MNYKLHKLKKEISTNYFKSVIKNIFCDFELEGDTDLFINSISSLNYDIDLGQIEGGYVQGLGWLTTEEISWNNKCRPLSYSPSTYKIPVSNDIPEKFYVNLYKKGMNKENVINRSKAVGEPPLMLAISAFIALKNATNNQKLKAPASPENILMGIKK